MTMLLLGAAGLVLAALAAAWPYLPKRAVRAVGLDRADWVNRLFLLAGQADQSGEEDVASAARSLIAALVAGPQVKG